MKCEKCGTELPYGAKYCDICGAAVKRETYEERDAREAKERETDRKRRRVKRIASLMVIVAVIIAAWNILLPKDKNYNPDLYTKLNRVSAENYSKLSEGLKPMQVWALLGKGYKYGEYGNKVVGGESTYIWPGEYIEDRLMYSEVKVIFDNRSSKVSGFSENNVIDGKEIYANLKNGRKAISRRTKEDIDSIQKDQSYEEFASFMGIDGILIDSKSNSDGSVEKEYVWHFYGEDYGKTKVTAHFFKGRLSEMVVE